MLQDVCYVLRSSLSLSFSLALGSHSHVLADFLVETRSKWYSNDTAASQPTGGLQEERVRHTPIQRRLWSRQLPKRHATGSKVQTFTPVPIEKEGVRRQRQIRLALSCAGLRWLALVFPPST